MTHAFNVTHITFYILQGFSVEAKRNEKDKASSKESGHDPILTRSLFSDLDILSMLLAALGHDLDHPGLPNGY